MGNGQERYLSTKLQVKEHVSINRLQLMVPEPRHPWVMNVSSRWQALRFFSAMNHSLSSYSSFPTKLICFSVSFITFLNPNIDIHHLTHVNLIPLAIEMSPADHSPS